MNRITQLSAEPTATAGGKETTNRSPSRRGSVHPGSTAASRRKTGKKPKGGKNAARGSRKAEPCPSTPPAPRAGTKLARVLELLQQPGGATLEELMNLTGWQAHSVRGFLSGVVGKKRGLTVISRKGEDNVRRYSISV
jgi:Protein of unknown function (DUF3489)